MPTPIFICGGECGITGTGTPSGGTEHWSTALAVTNAAHPLDASRKAMRHQPTLPTGGSQLLHTLASTVASPAIVVVRFRVYFTTFPIGDVLLGGVTAGGSVLASIAYESSDNTLQADAGGTRGGSFALSTGVEYLIDARFTLNATRTVEWQVDGTAQTTASVAAAASSVTTVGSAVTTATAGDFYVDDLIFTATSGDYPIGNGKIVGLYPNADGSHTYNAAGDFGKGASGGTNLATPSSAETTAYQSLANPLSTSIGTNWVSARASDTTLTGDRPAEFLRFAFDDLPSDASLVNGVMCVATCHAASATACNHRIHIDDGSSTPPAALINADLSESTINVPCAIASVAGDSAAWNVTKVNATLIRFSSSDVNPDAYLDGVCLEVDYVPISPIPPPVFFQNAIRPRFWVPPPVAHGFARGV